MNTKRISPATFAGIAQDVTRAADEWQKVSHEKGIRFIPFVADHFNVTNDTAASIMDVAVVTYVRRRKRTADEIAAAKEEEAQSPTLNNQTLRLDGRLDLQGATIKNLIDHVDSLRRITQGHLGRIDEHWKMLQENSETITHLGSENRRAVGAVQTWQKRIEELEALVPVIKSMQSPIGTLFQRLDDQQVATQQAISRVIKLEADQGV